MHTTLGGCPLLPDTIYGFICERIPFQIRTSTELSLIYVGAGFSYEFLNDSNNFTIAIWPGNCIARVLA